MSEVGNAEVKFPTPNLEVFPVAQRQKNKQNDGNKHHHILIFHL